MDAIISTRNAYKFTDILSYGEDNTHTKGVNMMGLPILGLLVPVINAGTLTIEISIDGSNWYALKKADGTTDAISVNGGATPFFVSSDVMTPLAAYVGNLRDVEHNVQVRLKTGAAQTADRTFTWIGVA